MITTGVQKRRTISMALRLPVAFKATFDPFNIRTNYADDKKVMALLDHIEEMIQDQRKRGLSFYRVDFTPLSRVYLPDKTYPKARSNKINLERLVGAHGFMFDPECAQYPIEQANFEDSDLRGVSLRGACLGVAFARTNLKGADLTGAFIDDYYPSRTDETDGQIITGDKLKKVLMHHGALIDETTMF